MTPVTIANCEDEPIHVPEAIQPHGVLIVCSNDDLRILEISESVEAHLGRSAASVLGAALPELLQAESAARLRHAATVPALRSVNPLRLRTDAGQTFEAVLHRPPGEASRLVVELEPIPPFTEASGLGFDPRMRSALVQLQAAVDERTLIQIAADQVRALTDFDRVMIYRFDQDWNGSVVAESKRTDLESFLGQQYPASDIPAQARRLYELNWLRLIADVGYRPSALVRRGEGPPLDMSHAVLRSVSPIHLQYLKNMRVTASMSISLLRAGKLSGLIACHHYSGRHLVPFSVRETCEYLGQVLAWQEEVLRAASEGKRSRAVEQREAEVMRSVATHGELLDGLASADLVALPNAAGAAVVLQEGIRRLGITPNDEQLATLLEFLGSRQEDIFVTKKLADELPPAAAWQEFAAGMLAVTISKELGEYLLWFRPMTERAIDWAGNPDKDKLTGGTGIADRLTPRGSFEVWREIVRGQSLPWERWEVEGASSLRRLLLGGVRRRASELRSLNNRLLDADRAKNEFIANVSHELRTPLHAIAGWTQMLRKGSATPELTEKALDVIARNVETQAQLIEDLLDLSRVASGKLRLDVHPVDLSLVVEGTIQSLTLSATAKMVRIASVLETDRTTVLGDALRIRQIVTNLLTNAIKFTPKEGSVHVALRRLDSDVELSVTDSGQGITPEFLPHVFDIFRQEDAGMNRRSHGLGLGLAIVKKLVELHGGHVWAESDGLGRGASFFVRLPISPLHRPEMASEPVPARPAEAPPVLAGLHVLVVEDEQDSRDLIKHILEDAQMTVTAVADAAEALNVLANSEREFDMVVSDIGLPVVDGISFMRAVRQRPVEGGGSLPAVALTAHTRAVDRTRVLQAGFNAHVPKPVDPDEFLAVLMSIARRNG